MQDNLITDEKWNMFIDTGKVDNYTLVLLSKKIAGGEPMTQRETSIYNECATIIEDVIQKIKFLADHE